MPDSSGQNTGSFRLTLFTTFFRIGLFTFGGGFAMLPLIERELAGRRRWITADDLLDIFAVAQSMPGPIAVNSSIFIGQRLAGFSGALAAMLGCVLPSVLVILAVAAGLSGFQDVPAVRFFFEGVLAAVTALILQTAIKMGRKVVRDVLTALLAAASFILVALLGVHALLLILTGAFAGAAVYWIKPARFSHPAGQTVKTPEQPGSSEHPESPDQAEETGSTGQPEQPGCPEIPDQAEETGSTGQPEPQERADSSGETRP